MSKAELECLSKAELECLATALNSSRGAMEGSYGVLH